MFHDAALARRIELADAMNAAGCGESIPVAGGFAAFCGAGSPLTHAIGVAMSVPITEAEFDVMEDFYRSRGANVNIDFCPHADPSLPELLGARGYRIVECNNVLVGPVVSSGAGHRVQRTEDEELWSRTVIEGFFGNPEFSDAERDIGRRLFQLEGTTAWIGTIDSSPAAAAAMNTRGSLAFLFADSTLLKCRGQGLHLALIRARLQYAAALGCDLATATTLPGSISQHNYERAGFRVAYTKLNMQRDWI